MTEAPHRMELRVHSPQVLSLLLDMVNRLPGITVVQAERMTQEDLDEMMVQMEGLSRKLESVQLEIGETLSHLKWVYDSYRKQEQARAKKKPRRLRASKAIRSAKPD